MSRPSWDCETGTDLKRTWEGFSWKKLYMHIPPPPGRALSILHFIFSWFRVMKLRHIAKRGGGEHFLRFVSDHCAASTLVFFRLTWLRTLWIIRKGLHLVKLGLLFSIFIETGTFSFIMRQLEFWFFLVFSFCSCQIKLSEEPKIFPNKQMIENYEPTFSVLLIWY